MVGCLQILKAKGVVLLLLQQVNSGRCPVLGKGASVHLLFTLKVKHLRSFEYLFHKVGCKLIVYSSIRSMIQLPQL